MAGNAPSHGNTAQGLNGESATNFLEDLSFVLDRNMGFAKGDKEDLFDLSIFEIPEKKAVPKEVENPTASVDTKKFQVAEGNTFSVGSLGSWDWTAVPNILNHRGVAFGLEDPGPWMDGWWRELGNLAATPTPTPTPMLPGPMPEIDSYEMAGRTRVVKQEPTKIIEDFGTDVVAHTSLVIPGGNPNLSSNGEPGVVVKCEPIDLFDSSPEPVANVTCLVQANRSSHMIKIHKLQRAQARIAAHDAIREVVIYKSIMKATRVA